MWVFFFIAFVVVGSLFMMNLFVGVVINTFNDEKEKLNRNLLLTETQREWIQIQLMCFRSRPLLRLDKQIKNKCRLKIYKFVTHEAFEFFIMGCIMANTIILAIKWYGEPETLQDVLDPINLAFASIFTIEAVVKLIAFKLK